VGDLIRGGSVVAPSGNLNHPTEAGSVRYVPLGDPVRRNSPGQVETLADEGMIAALNTARVRRKRE